MVGLLFRGDPTGGAGYKGNAVVNTKISLPPAAGGAVLALSLDSCQLDIVWKTHQSLWKNIEIRPKTNDMSDGKPASALIWSIFRLEINYFSKHSQLFPKETGEVLAPTHAQPLVAPQRQGHTSGRGDRRYSPQIRPPRGATSYRSYLKKTSF